MNAGRATPAAQRTRFLAAFTGLCLAGAIVALLLTSSKENPRAVPSSQAVARRVMSPFCPGLTLEECPSSEGARLRQKIDKRIAGGATNRTIDSWLVAAYGESVLARPPGAISWLIPAGVVLIGLAAMLFVLTGRGKREPVPPQPPGISADAADAVDAPDSSARSRMLEDFSRFAKGTE